MWPTVSYCCMSSSHRKGMNWRHSLIMKIVCIFLNWETSLRLHRVVLLHITWEGKNTFFCSNNNLLSDTTIHLQSSCIKKKLLKIEIVKVEFLFQVAYPAAFCKRSNGTFGRKTKASPAADQGAASLVCVWMCACLLLFVAHFPNYSLKRRKSREGKRMWTFCFVVVMLWRLWKNSSQLMWKDRTDTAR